MITTTTLYLLIPRGVASGCLPENIVAVGRGRFGSKLRSGRDSKVLFCGGFGILWYVFGFFGGDRDGLDWGTVWQWWGFVLGLGCERDPEYQEGTRGWWEWREGDFMRAIWGFLCSRE
ncbi:hypothetical protein ES288_D11G204800v1 [Gossypium darwinii]|uniref:Uncharacterized protein n=1 Tax=Gossypium darwinii TaxID=34276 RepID=A0A5D2AMW6_GOSDA|nr:hypothetical protein ES288_D11G204800v1 [Gossypium darwinii]